MDLRLLLMYDIGSAYDSLKSTRWMNGRVAICMPDFKYRGDKLSAQYLKHKDSNISSGDWTTVHPETYQNFLPLSQETTSMKEF